MTEKSYMFLFLAAGLCICYFISDIYHEKLLKKSYRHINTGYQQYFNGILLFSIFPPLFATILGKIILSSQEKIVQETINKIPYMKSIACALLINLNAITFNGIVIEAPYLAVILKKPCSLFFVILVAVCCCSRVKESQLKLSKGKLMIGLIATLGIFLLKFYQKHEKVAYETNPSLLSIIFGSLFLFISLLGDGFLPDFQAQIKSECKPSAINMYYQINQLTLLIGLTLAIFSKQIITIFVFLFEYEDFLSDSLMFTISSGIGQLFIYKMIVQFRQHIPAFVITFRNFLTTILTITTLEREQVVGIALFIAAILWQLWSNKNSNQVSQIYEQIRKKVDNSSSLDLDETDRILQYIQDELQETTSEPKKYQMKMGNDLNQQFE